MQQDYKIKFNDLMDMIVKILNEHEENKIYKNKIEHFIPNNHQLVSISYFTTDVEKVKTSPLILTKKYKTINEFEQEFINDDDVYTTFLYQHSIKNVDYNYESGIIEPIKEEKLNTLIEEGKKHFNDIYDNYIFSFKNPYFIKIFNRYPYLVKELQNCLMPKDEIKFQKVRHLTLKNMKYAYK